MRPYSLDINFVTNNDWMEFIKDDGYKRPEFWFSDGWDYINHNKISRPLYWLDNNYRYSLRGVEKIKPYQPVSHISFYEANAYSKYRNKRLPTEFELEFFLKSNDKNGNFLDSKLLCPVGFSSRDQNINSYGNLWCWTSSNYTPFRNFTPFFGKLNEYNEKFMCNQFVLKGGSFGTPINHIRSTYRNFYYPHDRWQFCGLKLVEDIV